jgi:Cu(I)/Ag(I) efflux system membrane protein CusA/SilA
MKPIATPIVGGMITSTIHVLILVPVFFVMMKGHALKRGTLVLEGDSVTPAFPSTPQHSTKGDSQCASGSSQSSA